MKNAVFVTARLKSTRLPFKAIKPLMGRPLFTHLLDRMKKVTTANIVVVCTSHLAQDDPLELLAREEGVLCFRGDPVDVLSRLNDAAQFYGVDNIVSCTADNPLTDTEWVTTLLRYHITNKRDYSVINGLPIGTYASVIRSSALNTVCEKKAEKDTEIWGDYFLKTNMFKIGSITADMPETLKKARLTVDTPEDFSLMERIFIALYEPGRIFGLSEVGTLLDQHPEWAKLNAHIQQKSGKTVKLIPPKIKDARKVS